MINHARTLLLNVSGTPMMPGTYFGHEYIPLLYSALELPQALLTVRKALFGSAPDLAGLNYSVWQYMRVLHSTEFSAYVYALDDRITYLNNKSLVDYEYGVQVDNGAMLDFTGQPGLGGANGRLSEHWKVAYTTPNTFELINIRTAVTTVQHPTVTNYMTDYMPLPGYASYMMRVNTYGLANTLWNISYIAEPGIEMDVVTRAAQLANIGAKAYSELFPDAAPYKLFKQLWEHHSLFPYKLSGLLLALIYKTEERRLGNGS